jgi:hypothetical protein
MNAEELDDKLPPVFDVHGPDASLADLLLNGQLIRYTDDRFQVSSGACKYIFKLNQENNKFVLFYTQIPYAYPLPDELIQNLQSWLEAVIKNTVNITFINAGTQALKHDVLTTSVLGD